MSLTWMLHGTSLWDTGIAWEARTSVAQTDGILPAVQEPLSIVESVMQVLHPRCAGVDVHKKSVVASVRLVAADGTLSTHLRSFGTTTAELLNLVAWLVSLEVSHVAMESTGEFWKPVYNLLEGSFTVLVVNAAHIKYVPGRKTDVKDAEWIAELLAHGLLRPSFVPPAPQRALRDLTRQRTHLVQERASVVNRMQKVLEWANIKLASVVTDITEVSARKMLQALVEGQTDVTELAELAKGRLRSKRAELEQALRGTLFEHHAFMISQHLALLDVFDEQIRAAIEGTRSMPPTEGGTGPDEHTTTPDAPTAPDGAWAA